MENNYVCHSGGCPGADLTWEQKAREYNIKTISYSFPGHVQFGKNPVVLTSEQLEEGWQQVLLCEKPIKRPLFRIKNNPYVKHLLCRNWFQVKNSDAIYAVGSLTNGNNKIVDGGTGWAVQMAINNDKNVFLFEQNLNQWFMYSYLANKFMEIYNIPPLTDNFAGIGTRAINENGEKAIQEIFKFNFYGQSKTIND